MSFKATFKYLFLEGHLHVSLLCQEGVAGVGVTCLSKGQEHVVENRAHDRLQSCLGGGLTTLQ